MATLTVPRENEKGLCRDRCLAVDGNGGWPPVAANLYRQKIAESVSAVIPRMVYHVRFARYAG